MSLDSLGRPMSLAVAPVAMMTVCASHGRVPGGDPEGRAEKSTSVTSSAIISVPKRSACFRKVSIIGGPSMPSTKPG